MTTEHILIVVTVVPILICVKVVAALYGYRARQEIKEIRRKVINMEASTPVSQVQPMTPAAGVNDPNVKFENLEPGLVWGVRSGHLSKDSLPDPVKALFDKQDGGDPEPSESESEPEPAYNGEE